MVQDPAAMVQDPTPLMEDLTLPLLLVEDLFLPLLLHKVLGIVLALGETPTNRTIETHTVRTRDRLSKQYRPRQGDAEHIPFLNFTHIPSRSRRT